MLPEPGNHNDPFDLTRFVSAQEHAFEAALSELRRGQKQGHWMWFIFPQIDGLGSSPMAKKYAIKSPDEARAYLDHPVLGIRLLKCCRAILAVQGKSVSDIFGYPDDMKLRSSMTLFSAVAGTHGEFGAVIAKYFGGHEDARTTELLKPNGQ